ncbi:MAG: glycosyltransferase family 4 protein [Acidimicrobiales bacterium]
MHVHFVNENVGGHTTMHSAIRSSLAEHTDVSATFWDVPPATGVRRALSAHVPGLPNDIDFQPLRDQLAKSAVVRRHLGGRGQPGEVLHIYTHNVGLLSAPLLRHHPSVVSLDATNEQNAYRLPQARPGRATRTVIRATRVFEDRVYRAASFVVAQSEWAAASLRDDYGVEEDRLRVIPFGIVVPDLPPAQPSDAVRITFIGRSMERKGGWRLLDLWRRHLRHEAILTLITLDAVAPEPGLEVITDMRPGDGRLAEILRGTTVLAAPTEVDTFGYAAMEAMAAEVPVVSTRTAAIPEVVEDGVTGALVEQGDDANLLTALRFFLNDPARNRRFGEAGRRRVLERFDARLTTAALVAVLREAHTQG